jgi:hypothetical protein
MTLVWLLHNIVILAAGHGRGQRESRQQKPTNGQRMDKVVVFRNRAWLPPHNQSDIGSPDGPASLPLRDKDCLARSAQSGCIGKV